MTPDHAGLSRIAGGQQGRIAWLTMQCPSSGLGMPAKKGQPLKGF
jgi:hypothetical protein